MSEAEQKGDEPKFDFKKGVFEGMTPEQVAKEWIAALQKYAGMTDDEITIQKMIEYAEQRQQSLSTNKSVPPDFDPTRVYPEALNLPDTILNKTTPKSWQRRGVIDFTTPAVPLYPINSPQMKELKRANAKLEKIERHLENLENEGKPTSDQRQSIVDKGNAAAKQFDGDSIEDEIKKVQARSDVMRDVLKKGFPKLTMDHDPKYEAYLQAERNKLGSAASRYLSGEDDNNKGADLGITEALMGEALKYRAQQVPTQGKLSDSPELKAQGPEKPKEVDGPQ